MIRRRPLFSVDAEKRFRSKKNELPGSTGKEKEEKIWKLEENMKWRKTESIGLNSFYVFSSKISFLFQGECVLVFVHVLCVCVMFFVFVYLDALGSDTIVANTGWERMKIEPICGYLSQKMVCSVCVLCVCVVCCMCMYLLTKFHDHLHVHIAHICDLQLCRDGVPVVQMNVVAVISFL